MALRRAAGRGMRSAPRRKAPGDGGFAAADLLGGALGHHVAAVLAGAGAQVHHVVRGQDGLQVVLHHQHGVAQVAHLLEGVQQLLVVPLVQADAGLVQDVHDALELGADLGGQADALALAAAEGGGGAVQGQVAQAHVVQEAQALLDLLQHLLGDDGVLAFQAQALEPGPGLAHAQGRQRGDVQPAHEHREHLRAQPRAPRRPRTG